MNIGANMKYTTINVHISEVIVGDSIVHQGVLQTVSANNIKSGFCGVTLFGDSYRLGTIPVLKAKFFNLEKYAKK